MTPAPRHIHRLCAAMIAVVIFPICGMAARDLPELFKWQKARENERFRSPLFIDNGRVIFLQPDWTLTVLDLGTGTVLLRDAAAHKEDWCYGWAQQVEWVVRGRLLLGVDGRYGVVVIDRETGHLDLSYCKSPSNEDQPLLYGREVALRSKHGEITFLNQDTLELRRLPPAEFSTFNIIGNRLFVFTESTPNRKGRLECYGADTLELVWKRESGPGEYWAAMACLEDAVHIVTKPLPEGNHRFSIRTEKVNGILEFDPDGGEPRRREPEAGEFFDERNVFASRFFYRGVYYRLGRATPMPALFDHRGDRNGLAAMLGVASPGKAILNSVVLPDGKVFGIYNTDRSARRFSIFLAGDERIWEGEVGCVEDTARYYYDDGNMERTLFSFAYSDEYLLYASPNGKVECLDRTTGRSRWLYSCPSFDYRIWHRPYPPLFAVANWDLDEKCFYTSVREEYGDSLNASLQRGVEIRGRSDPPPRIAVDPAPMPFPEAGLAPVMAWLPPLGTLALFICLYAGLARGDWWATSFLPDRRQIVLPSLICLLLCYGAYHYFGRYSAAAMYLQWTAIVVVLLFDFGVMVVHPRYFEERMGGTGNSEG